MNNGKKYDFKAVYPVTYDYDLLRLLEKKVLSVYTDKQRTDVTLEFEENMVLIIYGSDSFESYTLKMNNEEAAV